jgi:squalene-hopene/tetraprenyl-beta-curcumene cyclase
MSPPIKFRVNESISIKDALTDSIQRAQELILEQQAPDGYWWYSLQANETIGSGYIMLAHFLGCIDPSVETGLCRRLLDEQQDDGSWTLYHGADGDLSATVETYLALRLAGYPTDHEALMRARMFILNNGGLKSIRIFTRIHLAIFGLIPWEACPSMPVWLIFMPAWSRLSIYEFSSWARASIVPLLLVQEKKPVRPVHFNLDELSDTPLAKEDWVLKAKSNGLGWEQFFIKVDYVLKRLEKIPWHPGKQSALHACEKWVRKHLERTEDIYPALAYGAMGLGALGYSLDDYHLAKALKALKKFQQIYIGELPPDSDPISLSHPIEDHPTSQTLAHPVDSETIRIHQQCCISPLWDTPWNITALLASDYDKADPSLQKATRYILSKQIIHFKGDWAVKNSNASSGGWAFEFENDYFPDVDDTIQILSILKDMALPDEECKLSIVHGLAWLYSMQSSNGGWAAFDVNNTANWVNSIPFSDHGACLDQPTADITGRMIGLLAQFGTTRDDPIIKKALRFIEQDQHISNDPFLVNYTTVQNVSAARRRRSGDAGVLGVRRGDATTSTQQMSILGGRFGGWWGRWGVNYIYGTWCVLSGLSQIGISPNTPMIRRAVEWLKAVQCEDGGWGESCHGYTVKHFVPFKDGVPSQTAWAVMALIAAGEADSDAVQRGIEFLLERQRPDGGWDEEQHTGTGFPGHFYLRYHGYRHYFPLMALGKFQESIK